VPETSGILAIGLPGGALIDALGEEGLEGRGDIRRMPLVLYGSGQACGAATLAVDAPQPAGPKIRRHGPTVEIASHGIASKRRNTQLLWATLGPQQTSWKVYGMAWTRILFDQRLARGLSIFMKKSG
jgi:hypothetical protein